MCGTFDVTNFELHADFGRVPVNADHSVVWFVKGLWRKAEAVLRGCSPRVILIQAAGCEVEKWVRQNVFHGRQLGPVSVTTDECH